VVTWAAKARFRVWPCRVICPGGAEVAFGLDRSVAVVTLAAKARFRVLPCRVICLGGAEVVRRMAPHELQRIP